MSQPTTNIIRLAFLTLLCIGCTSATKPRVAEPSVDPRAAATEAMQLYDTDKNGSLSEAELAACPALKRARERYDADGNKQISLDEIANHLQSIYRSGVGLLEVHCTVYRQGKPLSGAKLRFVPEPFLGPDFQPALATTEADGTAVPSIPADQLPEQLRRASMMQVGLYRVEVEHPSLPAGKAQALGCDIDPTSRTGTTVRLDLE